MGTGSQVWYPWWTNGGSREVLSVCMGSEIAVSGWRVFLRGELQQVSPAAQWFAHWLARQGYHAISMCSPSAAVLVAPCTCHAGSKDRLPAAGPCEGTAVPRDDSSLPQSCNSLGFGLILQNYSLAAWSAKLVWFWHCIQTLSLSNSRIKNGSEAWAGWCSEGTGHCKILQLLYLF